MNQPTESEQWAIIELMGHQQIAGRYQEAAGGMHRIDVPGMGDEAPEDFHFTRLYSPAAIYSITFTDEASARLAAKMLAPKPVAIWGFEAEMRRLAAPAQKGETLEARKAAQAGQDYPDYNSDDDYEEEL